MKQTDMFSQPWKLEVQDQGAVRVGVWCGLSSWFVNGQLLAMSLHGHSFVSA